MSSAEQKLENLHKTLIETSNTAKQLADQLAAVLNEIRKHDGAMPSKQNAPQQPLVEVEEASSFIGSNFNPNIISLISNEKFTWDMSPKNIIDLKDYCFVQVAAKSATSIGFTFISSSLGKVVLTQNYDQEIHDMMVEGGIYVCHNVRKGRKLHWDKAICLTDLGLTKEQCVSKAKALARIFAEQK